MSHRRHTEILRELAARGEEDLAASLRSSPFVVPETGSDSESGSESESDTSSVRGGEREYCAYDKKYVFDVPAQLAFMPKVTFPTNPLIIDKIRLTEYSGDKLDFARKFTRADVSKLFIGTLEECLKQSDDTLIGLRIPTSVNANFEFFNCKYVPIASVSRDEVIVYLIIDDRTLAEYDVTQLRETAFFDTTTY